MVLIPDIFESFMSREPTLNIHYETVREEALLWAIETCKYNEEEGNRMRRGDFAYFGAITVPDARSPELRTVIDWLNWVFVFDDQLDDGPLGRKREEACKYIDGALVVLREDSSREKLQPIQWVLQDIWRRIRESRCPQGAKKRWVKHQKQYLEALRDAIGFAPSRTLEETLAKHFEYRFHSIGVFVLYSLVEYACGLELPDEVFENPSIIELERIGVEIQMIANDCVSYHREKDQDCPHNIIYLFRHHGMSEQEAYDRSQLMLRERYREWYLALANLPIYGEKIDKEVHRYIQGIQDVASANAHWSFRSERYFGKNRKQIRETRVLNDGKMDWVPAIMLAENNAINRRLKVEGQQ